MLRLLIPLWRYEAERPRQFALVLTGLRVYDSEREKNEIGVSRHSGLGKEPDHMGKVLGGGEYGNENRQETILATKYP